MNSRQSNLYKTNYINYENKFIVLLICNIFNTSVLKKCIELKNLKIKICRNIIKKKIGTRMYYITLNVIYYV